MTPPENIRAHFIEWLTLLSDLEAQVAYEKRVPFVPAHVELFETFYDCYYPRDRAFVAAFTEEERSALLIFERHLAVAREKSQKADVHCVEALQQLPEWKALVGRAQLLRSTLEERA